METILRMKEVRHNYNGRIVLDINHLEISTGSITGLAGPNGSGKTTLLKLLSLTEGCREGTVYFQGKPAAPFLNNSRHRMTMLPQEPYLLKRSVFENISYGLKIRRERDNPRKTVIDALELVGLNPSFAERQWHELSGGEAQRVALAARLALKPACLILDEPTASVDMESARSIRKAVLMARRDWGTTLIIASHHGSWLNDICDRIIYLYNGRILDCSFDNVLLGPWTEVTPDLYIKALTDGQKIFVTRPPAAKASAVIDPKHIKATIQDPPSPKRFLMGKVTGIYVDSHFSGPRLHVTCGDQRFIATIPDTSSTLENFQPGNEVFLVYHPEDFVWLPE